MEGRYRDAAGRGAGAAPYIGKDGTPSDAVYDYCLPWAYTVFTLLPVVRDAALQLFANLGSRGTRGSAPGRATTVLDRLRRG